ncbi:hypothetical protein DFH07DRAFT_768989 [Mycena maculata]|uniref:Uncharacterized protein n=1 Tax=Mycena maculata TaxID=230809 RepID=A0AAD7JRQ3_9AGAR|nr:hypothetical protein DFH07DRAFT_768989 [Mycena maculata]
MAQKELGTAICPVFDPFLLMKWFEDSTRTYIHDTATAYHHICDKNIRKNCKPWNEKYAQARFSAKRANGLAKPTNGLASRNAGLGLGATPKSKPKPEKARLRGRKPVLQAENVTLAAEASNTSEWEGQSGLSLDNTM